VALYKEEAEVLEKEEETNYSVLEIEEKKREEEKEKREEKSKEL
jgi:hypothetical protein